jgi:uncharacterized membrane-anchored protein
MKPIIVNRLLVIAIFAAITACSKELTSVTDINGHTYVLVQRGVDNRDGTTQQAQWKRQDQPDRLYIETIDSREGHRKFIFVGRVEQP